MSILNRIGAKKYKYDLEVTVHSVNIRLKQNYPVRVVVKRGRTKKDATPQIGYNVPAVFEFPLTYRITMYFNHNKFTHKDISCRLQQINGKKKIKNGKAKINFTNLAITGVGICRENFPLKGASDKNASICISVELNIAQDVHGRTFARTLSKGDVRETIDYSQFRTQTNTTSSRSLLQPSQGPPRFNKPFDPSPISQKLPPIQENKSNNLFEVKEQNYQDSKVSSSPKKEQTNKFENNKSTLETNIQTNKSLQQNIPISPPTYYNNQQTSNTQNTSSYNQTQKKLVGQPQRKSKPLPKLLRPVEPIQNRQVESSTIRVASDESSDDDYEDDKVPVPVNRILPRNSMIMSASSSSEEDQVRNSQIFTIPPLIMNQTKPNEQTQNEDIQKRQQKFGLSEGKRSTCNGCSIW